MRHSPAKRFRRSATGALTAGLRATALGAALLWTSVLWAGVLFGSVSPAFSAAPAAPGPAPAAPSQPDGLGVDWSSVSETLSRQLDDDQKTLDAIFLKLRSGTIAQERGNLAGYMAQIAAVRQNTGSAVTQIQSYETVLDTLLQILGDKAAPGEDPSVTAQRQRIHKATQNAKTMLVRAKLYDLQARQLEARLSSLSSRIQEETLSRRSVSPLMPRFWHALFKEQGWRPAIVQPNNRPSTASLLFGGGVLSLILTGGIAYFLHRFLLARGRFVQNGPLQSNRNQGDRNQADQPPDGQKASAPNASPADRSDGGAPGHTLTAVIPAVLNGVICALFLWIVWQIVLIVANGPLGAALASDMPLCGFILGTALPFGRTRSGLAGKCATWVMTAGLLAYGLLRSVRLPDVFGPALAELFEGAFAFLLAFSVFGLSQHLRRSAGTLSPVLQKIAPPLYGVSVLLLTLTTGSILLGYMSFAFTLNGCLLTLAMGLTVTVLLALFWRQSLEKLLAPEGPLGRRLSAAGLGIRRLSQLIVLFSGAGNLLMVLVLIAIVQGDGDYALASLFKRLHLLFVGSSSHKVPLSLDTVLLCLLVIVAAHYLIRAIRNWLDKRFFPTTALDLGAQNSIISVFTYAAWILVGLADLSIAGLSLKNLTWVVSALSVGVGFGLQSIVQNFISGLILLTGRPIRVGDVIEIAGSRGEVKRISVRATDIILGDGSTLIVPNSQFITATVKNASLGRTPARLVLNFTLPAEAPLDKARALLEQVTAGRGEILAAPAPQIHIASISATGIALTLTVALRNVRDGENVRDGLLLDVFRRFNQEEIAITMN